MLKLKLSFSSVFKNNQSERPSESRSLIKMNRIEVQHIECEPSPKVDGSYDRYFERRNAIDDVTYEYVTMQRVSVKHIIQTRGR